MIAVVAVAGCVTNDTTPPFDGITLLREGEATSQIEFTIGNVTFPSYRFAISSVGANVIEFPVVIPPNAALRVEFTVLPRIYSQDFTASAKPVEFSVEFQPEAGEPHRLFQKTVDIGQREQDRTWHRARLDLSRFAGRRGWLRLVNGETGPVAVSWGRPTLFDGVAESARPNLIFILVDALRADHLGSHGYARPTSPNLDAFARESIRYASAFTNAPMTVPSLPQILTSRYVPDNGAPTLASTLHEGGMPTTHAISNNPYLTSWMIALSRDSFDTTGNIRDGSDVTDMALDWIDDVAGGDRFALYIHYLDVHSPYDVPGEDAQPFIDPDYQGEIGLVFSDHEGAAAGDYTGSDRRRIADLYDGAIHYVDRQIGRLLEGLKSRDLFDSSMVVLTADHGEELWDHGAFFHGQSLYDEQLHVPLLIHLPGRRAAGSVVNEMVRTLDVLPTIADVLEMPASEGWEGESLVDAKGRSKVTADRDVFARATNPGKPFRSAVRTRDYKLVVSQEDGAEQLFHLPTDPDELVDLSRSSEHADGLAAMRARLDRFIDPLRTSGAQVRARSLDGAVHQIDLRLTSAAPITDVGRIRLRVGDRFVMDDDRKSLHWLGSVGPEPGGIRFSIPGPPDASARRNPKVIMDPLDLGRFEWPHQPRGQMSFEILVDGAPLPDEAVRLGPGISAPTSNARQTNEPAAVLAEVPSDPDAHYPVMISIWHAEELNDTGSEPEQLSEEDREQLRALGYAE